MVLSTNAIVWVRSLTRQRFSLHTAMLLAAWLLSPAAQAEWFKSDAAIMGTAIHVEVWHRSRHKAQQAIQQVLTEMHRVDRLMSPFKPDSELSQINQHAAKKPLAVSAEMFQLIKKAIHLSEISSGAFDITFASVGRFYDYRKKRKPNQYTLEHNLKNINYRNIVLDDKKQTVFFTRKGTYIDLGGIAKGHAVDNAITLLQQLGINNAMVTAGGDSRIIGDKDGRPWYVGIQDPRHKKQSAIVLPLSQTAISTSGDYERYFIQDNVRYHHILSPKTGQSVHDLRSVSILGPNSTMSDGLSTTVFVLGLDKGMQLIASLPQFEAIIIDNKGKIYYSNGLMPAQ